MEVCSQWGASLSPADSLLVTIIRWGFWCYSYVPFNIFPQRGVAVEIQWKKAAKKSRPAGIR